MALYFKLRSDCFLVGGENDAVVYDAPRGRIFLLDEGAYKILLSCEHNKPLGDWLGDSGMHLLNTLQDLGLGLFDPDAAYVDKLLVHQPIDWKGMGLVAPKFLKVDWAITNQCNLNCAFCGKFDRTISWQGCQTCLRRDRDTQSQWSPDCPEDFMGQIADLGIQTLHIRGADPALAWDYLLRVLQAARQTLLDVTITTPGVGQDIDALLTLCSEGQVRLNIVMFGIDDGTVSATCGEPNILAHQLALVDALSDRHLPFFLTFMLTHTTNLQRDKILAFVQDRWQCVPSFAEVYFKESIDRGFRLTHTDNNMKPLTRWRSLEEFFFRIRNNNCLFGNFEVSSDGNLRSCAGISRVLGDIANDGLPTALSGNALYDMWGRCKEGMQPCNRCALRYACIDCSVFELEGENDENIKEAYCPHDPSRGAVRAYRKNWAPADFAMTLKLGEEDTGR
ncbi:MAG: radical SAM protein [Halobacteriota archaeon]